jgi:DNA sulfur modification protein DndC
MKIGELVTLTKTLIRKMYTDENDQRPWAIAFSGGKDSTAVMGLVVSVIESLPIEKRIRKIYGVMSDTIVENPLVKDHMNEQAKLINKYCEKKGLPVSVNPVHRELKESYFVKTLGLGYPLPLNNGKGRWCTDRLKIKPQDEFLKEINPSYILTGVRHAESSMRSSSIDKWAISEFIGNHVSLKNGKTFNPIVNWTVQDVWKFLEMEGLSWGSTLSVQTIYKDATGECGFTNPEEVGKKSVEVCGARHGCWLCPVVLKDRSTEKMSEKYVWLEPLTEWRITQLRVYGAKIIVVKHLK